MKIVVAPDSFKGTLSAVEVANIICETGKKEYQNLQFVSLPVGASRLLEEGVAAMEFCSNSTFTIEKSLKYPKIALVEATERILDKLNHSLQS